MSVESESAGKSLSDEKRMKRKGEEEMNTRRGKPKSPKVEGKTQERFLLSEAQKRMGRRGMGLNSTYCYLFRI